MALGCVHGDGEGVLTHAASSYSPLLCLLATAGLGVYLVGAAALSARRGWWERRVRWIEKALGREG